MVDYAGSRTPGWVTYPRLALGLCSLGWFFVQGVRLMIPPLALPIKESLALSNAGFGIAVTVLWATYALLQFPGGLAADSLGFRTTLVVSSVVTAGGFALMGVSFGIGVFLVAAAVIGIGLGLSFVSSRTLPSTLYGDNKGRALGVTTAAGDVGGVLAPLIGSVVIAAALPWRGVFLSAAVGVVVLAVAFHAVVRGPYRSKLPDLRTTTAHAVGQITGREITLVIVAYSLFALAWQGTVAFIPLYMFEAKGLTIGTANLLLSAFFLVGVAVKPTAGWLSDIVGRHVLSVGSLVGAGLTLGALALFVSARTPVIVTVILFSATLLTFPPVTQAYLLDAFDDESQGSSFGMTRTVYVFIGSMGPAFVGIVSESFGYDAAFTAIAAGLLVGAVVLHLAVTLGDAE